MRTKHTKNSKHLQQDAQTIQNEKKKIRTLSIILFILFILVIAFTAVMIYLYIITGGIPDTLCGCFFAAATGEFGVMGWIRTTKDRNARRQYELEDRKYNDSVKENVKE